MCCWVNIWFKFMEVGDGCVSCIAFSIDCYKEEV